jgi:hypothetical protein
MESTDLLCAHSPNTGSFFLPDSVWHSTIRAQYPAFEDIFERHINNAKFDGVPIKGPDFRDLKLGVISLWYLQGKHKRMRPETRSALIKLSSLNVIFREHSDLSRNFPTFSLVGYSRSGLIDPRGGHRSK